VAKVLRQERPETKIILSEPINAQLIESGEVQERGEGGAPASSHPAFEPHLIQGWTPDFIPAVLQESIDQKRFDELVPIDAQEGIEASKLLARKEGIFTGISGGCTFAVAQKISATAAPGTVILCMLPDTGERYLSSPLFEDVGEAMNSEEIALSTSTPGFHLIDE
jgi:cysteine synthase A